VTSQPPFSANTYPLPFPCETAISIADNSWQAHAAALAARSDAILAVTLHHLLPQLPLQDADTPVPIEVSFLFTDDTEIQALNKNFRGKDTATNVLSFPDTDLTIANLQMAARFEEPLLLGDIAFAEQTIEREASEQNKSFNDHLAHLTVHGVLHLLGYDHMETPDALKMEATEIEILAKLGIDNPYMDNK